MEVNQDQTIPEEGVLEAMEDQIEVEIHETIEVGVEKDTKTKTIEIATADVVDGNTVKLKDLNFVNYSKVK